ncbi:hypothetical protein PsalN5692_00633 [Piscirickettsia salmonis]|uniref:hypothetical protein n=1 Tax=Piscirickettsia salmonis TaxID=1238 RepID=UPI002068D724|nr:hypothetical protein PsalN5692_00633 [Piscirickettsia salmonis]
MKKSFIVISIIILILSVLFLVYSKSIPIVLSVIFYKFIQIIKWGGLAIAITFVGIFIIVGTIIMVATLWSELFES